MKNLLRRYRFLLIIYVPALAVAAWEYGGIQPAPQAEMVEVLAQLDPASKNANFFQGLMALQRKDHTAARAYFERAIAAGYNDESDERLVYYYALILIAVGDDQARIDEAVARWRRTFPHSQRTDPREVDPRRIRYELDLPLKEAGKHPVGPYTQSDPF